MAPSSSTAMTSVQVALRIRPNTPQDATTIPARFQRTIIHALSNQTVNVDPTPQASASGSATGSAPPATAVPSKKQTFSYDFVLGPESTQHDLFQATAEPLISRFLEGFNCTILAYGQTSSGKTYSMTGVDLDADPSDPSNGMGIIPRSIATIFARAREMKEAKGGAWNFSIKGSFIELYNEDLIDLLSTDDGAGGRREVQIREDKDGHILWGGLREVSVKSTNEVMTLIRQGSAIRRTNETDMNAQSSRSHAIFSLTLTQKKYSGSSLPPRSTTPVPSGVRSPSRLARPSSTYSSSAGGRVSSPTFGRPGTPSFATAMARGGLRPSSALGSYGDSRKSTDDDVGEWVTVVSKFHFVDLAGSERLKRTAAQGDRVKEGISINSGLLALGNVISALGDPSRARSNTASHVPYRDSKLTRLLQDSLGGNAHTLMVACVSPAEWNAGETVNTLKYANRARNIKNRAVITEKEEGWDDVEWLQNMVTRLRKEVKGIKSGTLLAGSGSVVESGVSDGAGKKVVSQMMELQENYESLRSKFVERTEELTRLRRELGEKHRASVGGAVGGTGKYEEIVGPVIEEYEKTISAMEAELGLNRAALRHTNELLEETEEQYNVLTERHSATELYVEELKNRVGKVTEREASTEAYIRDLEERVKNHEENIVSSSGSVTDLKREITRLKEVDNHSSQYIADLEARLSGSEESILSLRQLVEKYEKDAESRREEVESLRVRLDSVLNDGESWRSDLEAREKKLNILEQKMKEWELKKQEAAEDRARLGDMVENVQQEKDSFNGTSSTRMERSVSTSPIEQTSKDTLSAESQLMTLQEIHIATLADLSSVSEKYQEALKEISDLAEQIREAKLNNVGSGPASSRSDSLERDRPEPLSAAPTIHRHRRHRDGKMRELGEGHVNSAGRRLFFRQAASAESLHTRSRSQSQSLSQELFSARTRQPSSPALESNGGSPIFSRHGYGARPNLSISLPVPPQAAHERSVASLEKEVMRLQEVLKEREAEIVVLERSLKAEENEVNGVEKAEEPKVNGHPPQGLDLSPQTKQNFTAVINSISPESEGDDDSLKRLNDLMLSMAQKESRHREEVEGLNTELATVRRRHDDLLALSRDQAHNMSTELEALRGKHDEVLSELEKLTRREAELLEEQQSTRAKHEEEIQALRSQHEQAFKDKDAEIEIVLSNLREDHQQTTKSLETQLAEASATLTQAKEAHEEAFGNLKTEHEKGIIALKTDLDEKLSLREEHQQSIAALHAQLAEVSAALTRSKQAHEEASGDLKTEHEKEIDTLNKELGVKISVREEHQQTIDDLQAQLVEASTSLSQIREAHEEESGDLKTEHEKEIRTLNEQLKIKHSLLDEHQQTIEDLQAQLVEAFTAFAQTKEVHEEAFGDLKAEHKNEVSTLNKELDEKRSILEEHQRTIQALEAQLADASASLAQTNETHERALGGLKTEHEQEILLLNKELDEKLSQTQEESRKEHERALAEKDALVGALEKDLQAATVGQSGLQSEVTQLRGELDATLPALEEKENLVLRLEERLSTSSNEQGTLQGQLKLLQDELKRMRTENARLMQEASSGKSAAEELERHRTMLSEVSGELQRTKEQKEALVAERGKHDALVRDLQAQLTRTFSNDGIARPTPERATSFTRPNGIPAPKPPPLSPPPSMPPPPAPKPANPAVPSDVSSISQTSTIRTSSSSKESRPDSPLTSAHPSLNNLDPKVLQQIDDQAKLIEEQEVMIKTLNKQLTHCESDLQQHIDLVSTLETSLGDSEKNLRKARMSATELARERDVLTNQIERLRNDLDDTRRENSTLQRSVAEEKQSLEQKLDEERKARERARTQLESRVEALQRRKSKFACI